MLSERRDEDAATAFFKQAINNNGFPDKVVMDKHDFILCTLGNKGELSQNLPINATEPLAFILKESGARCNGENIYLVSIANSLF
jgi:hypothetical protein